MKKLRVALVGCGLISEAHLKAYLAHRSRADVVVCCDPNRERAEKRAAQTDGARVLSHLSEVLDDPSVDSVDLLTPHHLHREQTVAALHAGKHVLLQKPLAHTIDDCEAIVAASRETDRTIYYAEMNRTLPAAVEAAKIIGDGRIGRLIATQSTYAHWQGGEYLNTQWRYRPEEAGGGQLLDGGIHQIAVMETAVGPIDSVCCLSTRFRPELGGEDTAVLAFEYENGGLGTFVSTHASAVWPSMPSFTAFGTEGLLTIGGPFGALVLHHRESNETVIEQRANVFFEMIGRYLDVVLEGAPNPSTVEWGRHQFQVVMTAYRSAATGQKVKVPA